MESEFERTELLLGSEKMTELREKTILVFGLGGVGSHCVEALARCGVGRLILVDHDRVELSNLNRQSIALHSTIGRYKTEVMRERIADICPDIQVQTFETFVLPENLDSFFPPAPGSDLGEMTESDPEKTQDKKDMDADAEEETAAAQADFSLTLEGVRPDYVIDAVDTVTAKVAIAERVIRLGIPMISSMGTGNKLHAEQFEITDLCKTSVCPLCRVMRRELKAKGITHLKVLYSKEEPIRPKEEAPNGGRTPGSISFVPPVAGMLIAGEAVRDLLGISEDA